MVTICTVTCLKLLNKFTEEAKKKLLKKKATTQLFLLPFALVTLGIRVSAVVVYAKFAS